jgi:linoleoyl-CoA desaturase
MSISSQPLRFQQGEQLEFFSTLRKRVDAYFKENHISKHANATMVWKTVILLSGYILPFIALVIFSPGLGVQMLLWLIMGFALAGVGMSVMHDANHGAYSNKVFINRLVGHSLNLCGGAVANWKVQHNHLHHMYTNVSGWDDDIENKLILKFSPHGEHKSIHRYQWWYAFVFYSILTLYWGLLKDLVQLIGYRQRGYHAGDSRSFALLVLKISVNKIVYFAIILGLPIMATDIPWYWLLTGFVLMHVVAGLVLSVVFQLAHTLEETEFPMPDDERLLDDSWAAHQLRTTANFSPNNKWLSWYVGGLNYQIEHHLFPGICHVHYPAIAPIVEQTAQEFGHPYHVNPTFGSALRSHMRLLYKLGSPSPEHIMG